MRGLTDALRAQQHEFSNRMHALAGLLELGETDEAMGYLTDLRAADADVTAAVRARIASSPVAGLVLAKAAIAAERGITLTLSEDTWLGELPDQEHALTTIIGNLVDNAFDALAAERGASGAERGCSCRSWRSRTRCTSGSRTTGPGSRSGAASQVFTDGYSTKSTTGPMRRGLGLALVHRTRAAAGRQDHCVRGARRGVHRVDPEGAAMIRTLVVDDDYRVSRIHAAYVSRVRRLRGGRRGAHAGRGTRGHRRARSRTWCCSTSTCPTAAASTWSAP